MTTNEAVSGAVTRRRPGPGRRDRRRAARAYTGRIDGSKRHYCPTSTPRNGATMTEQPTPTASERAGHWLERAAKTRRSNDATTAALVGIGHALRALAGADFPQRWIASHGTGEPEPVATTRVRMNDHGPNVCGWDFDALADLARHADRSSATRPTADALFEWFDAHGLDVDELGGRL